LENCVSEQRNRWWPPREAREEVGRMGAEDPADAFSATPLIADVRARYVESRGCPLSSQS
jgi:hypothetical protein